MCGRGASMCHRAAFPLELRCVLRPLEILGRNGLARLQAVEAFLELLCSLTSRVGPLGGVVTLPAAHGDILPRCARYRPCGSLRLSVTKRGSAGDVEEA